MGAMELSIEGAIEQLKDLKEDRKSFLDNDVSTGIINGYDAIFLKDIEAIDRVLQELDKLQKENEEYSKQMDLDYVDENFVSKDKIREKIEEIAGKQGYVFATEVLGDLLKEE